MEENEGLSDRNGGVCDTNNAHDVKRNTSATRLIQVGIPVKPPLLLYDSVHDSFGNVSES